MSRVVYSKFHVFFMLLIFLSLTDLQKVSSNEEPEHRSRAPPPARPTAGPQSPSSTMPASGSGNPFVTSDDDDTEQTSKPETLDTSLTPSNTDTQTSGNPFEETEEVVEEETNDSPVQPTAEPSADTVEATVEPVTDETSAEKPVDSQPVASEPTVRLV